MQLRRRHKVLIGVAGLAVFIGASIGFGRLLARAPAGQAGAPSAINQTLPPGVSGAPGAGVAVVPTVPSATPTTAPVVGKGVAGTSVANVPTVAGGTPVPSVSGVTTVPAGYTGDTTTTGTPVVTSSPTPPASSTTTAPSHPKTTFRAYVDPTFTQNPTNPLAVTYAYSASATADVSGVGSVQTTLPAGVLNLYSDGSLECSINVGNNVDGGNCGVTYSSFGNHTVVTEYITNSITSTSQTETEDIEPFGTTTVAYVTGGGSQGGIVFGAVVTDINGHSVMTGTVTLTISDLSQGWSYTVNGILGDYALKPTSYACNAIENYPTVGVYSGCDFHNAFQVSPVTGNTLVVSATYVGNNDWRPSIAQSVAYSLPA